ncbi:MAG TPA: type I 3-dehydroquinate dehydratase [Bacteroidales bacterium]|nr:type I 3-dehydroquinate dehydratase [Bacteroidales bacterium]
MICISIGSKAVIPEVNRLRPEIIELRYDLLKEPPELVDHLVDENIKRIATCRPQNFNEEQRLEILKQALKYGADYADVELESDPAFIAEIREVCNYYKAGLIISYHNFEKTPEIDELEDLLNKCYILEADISKLACKVSKESDAATLLSLYKDNRSKVIIGMGDRGRITRIASLFLGAPFSFAAFSREGVTAPGQYTFQEMNDLLRKL